MDNKNTQKINEVLNEMNKLNDIDVDFHIISKKIEKDLDNFINLFQNNNNEKNNYNNEDIKTNIINESENKIIISDIDYQNALLFIKKNINILNLKIEEKKKNDEKQMEEFEEYNHKKNNFIILTERKNQYQELLLKDKDETIKEYEDIIKNQDEKINQLEKEKEKISDELMKTIEEFENQMLNDENEINTLKENLKAKDIEINKLKGNIKIEDENKDKELEIHNIENKEKEKNENQKYESELNKIFNILKDIENDKTELNNDLIGINNRNNLKSIIYIILSNYGIPFSEIKGNIPTYIFSLINDINENIYTVLNTAFYSFINYKKKFNTNFSKDIFKNMIGNSEIIIPDEIIIKTRNIIEQYDPDNSDIEINKKIEELIKENNDLNLKQ